MYCVKCTISMYCYENVEINKCKRGRSSCKSCEKMKTNVECVAFSTVGLGLMLGVTDTLIWFE